MLSPESLRSLVECPVCFEVPRPARVFICVNGHSICGACKQRISACPQGQCQYTDPPTRNLVMESILQNGHVEVACINSEAGCMFEATRKDLERHEVDCEFRRLECPLEGCAEQIRAFALFDHVESACHFRSVTCQNQGCARRLLAHEAASHSSVCPFRPTWCPNPGCPAMTRADKMAVHQTVCKFKAECMPDEDFHATTSDRNPSLKIEVSSGDLASPLNNLSIKRSEAPTSASFPIPLSSETGATARTPMNTHAEQMALPLNNRAALFPPMLSDEDTRPSAPPLQFDDYMQAEAGLPPLTIAPIPPSCSAEQTSASAPPRPPVKCPNQGCTERLPARDLAQHLASECSERTVPCPLGCFRSLRASHVDLHVTTKCIERIVMCGHEGCTSRLPASANYNHMALCAFRPVQCVRCDVTVRAGRLQTHEQVECSMLRLACDNAGCTVKVLPSEMHLHQLGCDYRLVRCKHEGCHRSVLLWDVKTHEDQCGFRAVTCPEARCGRKLGCHQLNEHLLCHTDIQVISPGPDGFYTYSWALGPDWAFTDMLMAAGGQGQAWAPVRLSSLMLIINAFRTSEGLHIWASMLDTNEELRGNLKFELSIVGGDGSRIDFGGRIFPIDMDRDAILSDCGCLQLGPSKINQLSLPYGNPGDQQQVLTAKFKINSTVTGKVFGEASRPKLNTSKVSLGALSKVKPKLKWGIGSASSSKQ